jgi:hypothetical protein
MTDRYAHSRAAFGITTPCPEGSFLVTGIQFTPEHREVRWAVAASTIGEALTMLERQHAGKETWTYGILPEDYAAARAEGVSFFDGDGLLVDPPVDEFEASFGDPDTLVDVRRPR